MNLRADEEIMTGDGLERKELLSVVVFAFKMIKGTEIEKSMGFLDSDD